MNSVQRRVSLMTLEDILTQVDTNSNFGNIVDLDE